MELWIMEMKELPLLLLLLVLVPISISQSRNENNPMVPTLSEYIMQG